MFRWRFETQEQVALWRGRHVSLSLDGGLKVAIMGSDPWLYRKVDLDAGAVDEIVLVHRKLGADGAERLYFAGAGQDFSETRRVPAQFAKEGPMSALYRFDVAAHHLWKGKIAMLRLDPTEGGAGETIRIREIAGYRKQVDPKLLAKIGKTPYWFDLHGDKREALVLPAGKLLEWRLQVPRGGRGGSAAPIRRGALALEREPGDLSSV